MRIAVIGGVGSTAVLIEKLHEHEFEDLKVWGFVPKDVTQVSGWTNLASLCSKFQFSYQSFARIGECVDDIRDFDPDIIFAVGLSQLIPAQVMQAARKGCIGFHPTALPRGRGRAPIAWLILDQVDGAASFFVIREGVDDGPILAQQPFAVTQADDATAVEHKVLAAEAVALDSLLPRLKNGWLDGLEQDHGHASWYGRRTPDDGLIDWYHQAADVARLVRASTHPHPGAFTYCQDEVITILRAEVEIRAEKGVVGRLLSVDATRSFVVQCGQGILRVTEWKAKNDWSPRVGQKLGYYEETEIHRLRLEVRGLTDRIRKLEDVLHRLTGRDDS
jgi:methionyl-tRNA formyltransferase